MDNKLECRSGAADEFLQKIGVIWAQLPQEVIVEFLVWLPVKSLLRFRCVSKSFRSLIDSHYFINLHLNTSANNRTDHIKLVFQGTQRVSTNYNSAKLCVSDFENGLYEDRSLVLRNQLRKCLEVYGYCNCVFLLLVNSFQLVLWNPSTQKRKNIPRCPVKRDNTSLFRDKMGLGYDSTRDDYKVVLIAAVDGRGFEIWICGLRSNSRRMVQTDFFFREGFLHPFGYFAHGELHWLCSLNANSFYSEDIVAFDVVKETFSLVIQPVYPSRGRVTGMHVLGGCLCNNFLSEALDLVVLYIRKKDGADFTWNILYSVTTVQLPSFLKMDHFDCVKVLGYSKDGDEIILNLGLQYMISYIS